MTHVLILLVHSVQDAVPWPMLAQRLQPLSCLNAHLIVTTKTYAQNRLHWPLYVSYHFAAAAYTWYAYKPLGFHEPPTNP